MIRNSVVVVYFINYDYIIANKACPTISTNAIDLMQADRLIYNI